MTTQERINLLAEAALRAAPPSTTHPKPVTFMPSFEKMRSADFVPQGEPPSPPATQPLQVQEEGRDLSY
ncbi:hypothetical protein [Luteolibacter luteus]|uniref:Uncharacterized protein n=1 Tax=Luteolibacter luteus TaxID=2728835 RepID=A0A858REY9_9BACT|nr:hypothetical protein [Luteolibacter luteus]QJE95407.1 hypothetical protein HHL09_06305 [Luteolibacter luteus]